MSAWATFQTSTATEAISAEASRARLLRVSVALRSSTTSSVRQRSGRMSVRPVAVAMWVVVVVVMRGSVAVRWWIDGSCGGRTSQGGGEAGVEGLQGRRVAQLGQDEALPR